MAIEVPVLSVNDWRSVGSARTAFIDKFGKGLEQIGFVLFRDHGIRDERRRRLFDAARKVFAYGDDYLKERYARPDVYHQIGYQPWQVETAEEADKPDNKVCLHVRDDRVEPSQYGPMVFPGEVPEFKDASLDLLDDQWGFSMEVLPALEVYLGMPPGQLVNMMSKVKSLLRVAMYPKDRHNEDGGQPSYDHTDINGFTVVIAGSVRGRGLKVKTRDGRWIYVNEQPGDVVWNVADMFQILTKGRFVSGRHGVEYTEDGWTDDRYSAPFFIHFKSDAILDAATGLTADAALNQRLKEIGLAKAKAKAVAAAATATAAGNPAA